MMKIQTLKKAALISLVSLMISGCTSVPEGVVPVQGFEVNRYLGTWYEINRLDHSFEKNLIEVSADYSLRDDGGIRVINRGKDQKSGTWKEATGKAYFIGSTNTGSLKVSFFGPFYGGYHIAKLDPEYRMALVVGPDLDYAWILSRSEKPEKQLCEQFTTTAQQLGIHEDQWIKIRTCH